MVDYLEGYLLQAGVGDVWTLDILVVLSYPFLKNARKKT